MDKNIFDYSAYRPYLNDYIAAQPQRGRGVRSQWAEKLGCQKTFISQVLHGDLDFNLEHAAALSRVLHHTHEESRFFLLLVLYARAGTKELREEFALQMQEIVAKRLVLKNRFHNKNQKLSDEDKLRYYGSWHFDATRVALTIPKFRTRDAIAAKLQISNERCSEILDFLCSTGLAEEKGDQYFVTEAQLFLGNSSALIVQHHTNWRIRAMQSFATEKPSDLHYSAVYSLSEKDSAEIRKMLTDHLEKIRNKVIASPEEKLYSFCLDFYEL